MTNTFGNNSNNFSGNENVESVAEAIENAALEIVDEEIMRKEGEAHQHQLRLNHKAALFDAFGSAIAAPSVAITQHQPHKTHHPRVKHISANNRSHNDGRRATKCVHTRPRDKQYSTNEPPRPPQKIDRSISNSNNNNCVVNSKQPDDSGNVNKKSNSKKCNHAPVQAPVPPPVFMLSGQTFHQFTYPMGFMPPQFASGYPMPPPGGYAIPPAAPLMPITYSHPSMRPPPPTVAGLAHAPAPVHHDEKPINIDCKNPAPTKPPVPSGAKHAHHQPLNDCGRRNAASKRRPPTTSKKNPPLAPTLTQARSNPLNDPSAANQVPTESKPCETSNGQGGDTYQPQSNNLSFITTARFQSAPETKNSTSRKDNVKESPSLNHNCNRYLEMQQKQKEKENHSCNPLSQAPRVSRQTSENVCINQNHESFLTSAQIQDSAMAFASAVQHEMKHGQQPTDMNHGRDVETDLGHGSHTGKKEFQIPALPPLKPLDSKPISTQHAHGSRTTNKRPHSEPGNAAGGNNKSKKRKEIEIEHHQTNFPLELFTPRIPTCAKLQTKKCKGEYVYHSSHHSHKFLIRDFSSPHWDASESLPEGYVQFFAESISHERQTSSQTSGDCSDLHKPHRDSGKCVSLPSDSNCDTKSISVFPKRRDDAGYETESANGARDVFNRGDPEKSSEEESMAGGHSHVEL